jgi:hypothetical protein
MPRRKKVKSETEKPQQPVIKKKRGRKKKKTLDINQDDVVVIDLQRDNDIHNEINKKYNNQDKNIKQNKNNIDDLSNDLILHIKSNNNNLSSDISGASINNIKNNSLAPFNNSNNESYNINNFLSYKILENEENKKKVDDAKKTDIKNIFSFISKEKDTKSNTNTNKTNDTNNLDFNMEYDINTFNRGNNIDISSANNIINKNNQDILKDNINKIKYAFDNNRKWLSKTDIHCLWCCHKFESVPIAIPKKIIDDTFHLFGYFCSFNCAASYIFGTNILASNKWEYYSLLCLLQKKITGSDKYEKIKLAPPKECLKIFGGFLSIEEFREQFHHIDEYTLRMPPMVPIESTIENSIVK